MIINELNF